ncbi:MAG: CocE/NonD family hydrolase [Sterolibacterium sp.]|nr:CocE/NonD family hydrolase [Sterolibacterium sp.]MBP9798681.1 CocE/NonD family hydrolase [Sterolibacterium sp.]
MHVPVRTLLVSLVASLALGLLSACNGGSDAGGGTGAGSAVVRPEVPPPAYPGVNAASGATTTLGTRLLTAQANPPVTSNGTARWRNYTRPADYPGVFTLPLQFITTRSGKRLGVLVSLPTDASGNYVRGRFPVVLTQNAYRIDMGNALSGLLPAASTLGIGGADRYMIRRGYVSVTVDSLGSGVSEGQLDLFGPTEQATYADVVNWVVRQDWSNGRIGVAGTSYLGITSLFTAAQGHPSIQAVFVNIPMGDSWRDTLGTGGMLNGWFISNWLPLTQGLSVFNDLAVAKYPHYADQIRAATAEHIAAIDDMLLPLIRSALDGTTGYATDDGTFWSDRSPIEQAKNIRAPTFVIGSANDIFQRNEPLLYEQLKRNTTAKLLIVPGAHAESIMATLLNHNNPLEEGAPAATGLLLQWFDKYLKDMNSGAELQPTVTQFVAGLGNGLPQYATATDWPHPQAAPQRLYLRGNLTLTTSSPANDEATHTLNEPPAPEVRLGTNKAGTLLRGWLIPTDSSDKSISWLQWSLGFVLPLFDWYKESDTVERAQNAINFETGMMTTDYYLNGPMQADIWLSSTVSEAAINVRIDDVGTDGVARPITNGLMSAAFRAVDPSRSRTLRGEMIQPWHPYTLASKQLLNPGEAVKVPVEIFPAAAVIRKGHRLRVSISASNQAQGVWSTPAQARANGGVTTIYNDAARPSSVVLPVLPNSAL